MSTVECAHIPRDTLLVGSHWCPECGSWSADGVVWVQPKLLEMTYTPEQYMKLLLEEVAGMDLDVANKVGGLLGAAVGVCKDAGVTRTQFDAIAAKLWESLPVVN